MSGVEILDVTARMEEYATRLVEVYARTFTREPWWEAEEDVEYFASERIPVESALPGFKCVVARSEAPQLAGFAYGFETVPGTLVYDALRPVLSTAEWRRWFDSCFSFAELAVVPELRRCGIGSRLHDALLDGLGYEKSVLVTIEEAWEALAFYRARGWEVVHPSIPLAEWALPSIIMGLDLAAWRGARGSRLPGGTG